MMRGRVVLHGNNPRTQNWVDADLGTVDGERKRVSERLGTTTCGEELDELGQNDDDDVHVNSIVARASTDAGAAL